MLPAPVLPAPALKQYSGPDLELVSEVTATAQPFSNRLAIVLMLTSMTAGQRLMWHCFRIRLQHDCGAEAEANVALLQDQTPA